MRLQRVGWIGGLAIVALGACGKSPASQQVQMGPGFKGSSRPPSHEVTVESYSKAMIEKGREIFRHDTFGSEAFWGSQLQLRQAILGEEHGGVGPGLTAKQALELGLKVDIGQLPEILAEAVKGGSVDLDNVKTTIELLRADAVVGVKGFFKDDRMI